MQGIVRIRGQVQGVGFRPFVYRLAKELEIQGWVRNDSHGVEISVSGENRAVSDFLERLESESPALSRVDGIAFLEADCAESHSGFRIRESLEGAADTGISPDVSICRECLMELFDPSNRRYRHPFINCTHCGPRFTLLSRVPYDRKHTSMAKYRMCRACQAEYLDPCDRRFHAQPNACMDCGPRLSLLDWSGEIIAGDQIENALNAILSGKILAVKGIGGFHLVCDAKNGEAVKRLRHSKSRMEKPLALMAANSASLVPFAQVGEEERRLLESRERPIVLLGKRLEIEGIAPGLASFGAMLPYAPIHYLIFHEAAGRPEGTGWLEERQDLILVATSANPGGEPLATGNGEAFERLGEAADLFLLHDREILAGADDSVARWNGRSPQFVRRARGYAPSPLRLSSSGPAVLAMGAGYKNTVCATRGDEAFVSQHIGDLDNAAACCAMEKTVERLLQLSGIEPEIVVHDLHPDFHSTRFALQYSEKHGIPSLGVQHHHAHVASVLAENRFDGAALGVALDGVGLGTDGGTWGGELLCLDEKGGFSREGHFRTLLHPGGDIASREPWRMAAGALYSLGRHEEIARRYGKKGEFILALLERQFNCPLTSSAGRLFDAAAGLLGISDSMTFEGQAAMLLEAMAQGHGPVPPLENGFSVEQGVLDFLPLFDALAEMDDAGYGASLFHSTLVEGLESWILASPGNIRTIALSGGCFLNAILCSELRNRLESEGYAVLEARLLPPNDGGISLGQAHVAMRRKSCA